MNFSVENGNPEYVCSPHSTIIAAVIIVVIMNVILITAFIVFYRYKRQRWIKEVGGRGTLRPISARVHPASIAPPPLPSRPSTASGALGPSPPVYNSSTSPEVMYKDPRDLPPRQRFSGLSASSMTSLPR